MYIIRDLRQENPTRILKNLTTAMPLFCQNVGCLQNNLRRMETGEMPFVSVVTEHRTTVHKRNEDIRKMGTGHKSVQ